MDHQGLKVYITVYINDDLGLTLTYFTARSSLVKFAYYAYTRPIYRNIGPMVYIIFLSFFQGLVLSPGPALFEYIQFYWFCYDEAQRI